MLIAQVTDIHLGFEPDNPREPNLMRLEAVLAALASHEPRPDMILATGDLTEAGTPESYAALAAAFATCPIPVHYIMGNHDLRAAFRNAFPEVPVADGFIQYALDAGPLRILMLDTLEEGLHGGAFCEARAAWLDRALAEAPGRPTLVVLHHPPVDHGIDWMTVTGEEPWIARLAAVVSRHPQVVRLLAGHIHRAILAPFAGTTVAVCPSTAPQVALAVAPVDPEQPDGRPLIVAEPAGYALHWWNGRDLVTHYGMAGDHPVLARYEPKLQPLIQGLLAERAGTQSSSEPLSSTL